MEKWKMMKLAELATIKYGKSQKKFQSNSGRVPVYGTGGLIGYATECLYNKESVLIGRKGTIDKIRYVNYPFWSVDTLFYTIINDDIVFPRFLYYKLLTVDFMQMNEGTTIPSLRAETLNRLELLIPDIKTQKQIASVLSAYDDLIENNQEQIKLLEEIAQRLYKEWFVNLRFPDYENTPIIDGVPEGWRIGQLAEIGEFKRGKTITKDSVIVGDVPVVAGGLEPAYYHNTSNTTAPVITVSGSGANAGFTRMYHVDVWASDCSFVDINSTDYLYQIYCYLKASKADLNRLQKGSAQPHVYAKDINAMKCIIPDKKISVRFNKFVSPIFSKIGNLYEQIENLKESRDRLLPKLMNGEIDVSRIRI